MENARQLNSLAPSWKGSSVKSKSPENTLERFWAKVYRGPETDCWIWFGCRLATGYGKMAVNGIEVGAHRLSWEIHFGEIPQGMHICHECDNPSCVNPDHIFPGTRGDNMADMARKKRNRHSNGELKRFRKNGLCAGRVHGIRRLYAATKLTTHEIAKEFGIWPTAVNAIINGRSWGHLEWSDPVIKELALARAKASHRMGRTHEHRMAAKRLSA